MYRFVKKSYRKLLNPGFISQSYLFRPTFFLFSCQLSIKILKMTFSLQVLKFNCIITIFVFGIWYVFVDILFHIIPLGILIAGSLSLVTFYLRVPPPEKKAVEVILGANPNYSNGDDNGHVLIKTIGHRGAGLDAPENSLVAFKLVS